MINHANTIVNAKKRVALYQQIGKKLMEAAVIIPIYNLRGVFVGPATLKGIVFDFAATPLFHAVTY
jgi:ABC-type transport system substrate-binding protein